MRYNDFGKTGIKISALGYGAMRLPVIGEGDDKRINDEAAIPLMHKAFELGVNYIDSAPYYCHKLSEGAVGRAIKAWKGHKIYVSTKNPVQNDDSGDFMKRLESSLENLGLDSIDFYHLWGINLNSFEKWQTLSDGPLQAFRRAKDQGLIKHFSFSYHDKAENLKKIIDSGLFETVLIQYNLLERSNEDNIAYCKEKGIGTVIMGPVAGGRLGAPSDVIASLLKEKPASSAELAMRFVLSNKNVDVALSGMNETSMIVENAAIAAKGESLTEEEIKGINKMVEENKELAKLYCTKCNYCMPCPQKIDIPLLFGLMNDHRVFKLTEYSIRAYDEALRGVMWSFSESPESCTECGECEEKCPQKLPIIKQLKETHKTLGK